MRPVALTFAVALAASPALAPSVALAARPRQKAVTVDPTAPGELVISTVNAGALVEVDGNPIGALPLEDSILLTPGAHVVRVTMRGYRTLEVTLDIKPGQAHELEADLLPFAGLVRISSSPPGASVSVDGQPQGTTPFDRDVPAGDRTFLVRLPDHEDAVRTVEIAPTRNYDFDFALKPVVRAPPPASAGPAFYETWWFWTVLGVAGAGAAAAALAPGDASRPLVADLTVTIP